MKFDIEVIKRKMLVKYPFFGSIVANVEYKENKNIKTAGTDGKVIHYNPEFLEKLSVEEQAFIFAHEVCHIAFNHILRSEGKDPYVWNTATDAVINAFLKKDGLKMVEGGVDIADAINYDAEQLYEKLLKEKEQNSQNNKKEQGENKQSSSGGAGSQNNSSNTPENKEESQDNNQQSQNSKKQDNGNSSNEKENKQSEQNSGQGDNNSETDSDKEQQDVGHDTHSMWEDAIKKHKEQEENKNKKESLLDKLFNRNKKENKEEKSELEKKQEESEQLGEKEAFKKNLEEKRKELEELKRELSQQATSYGTTTNGDIRNITNIGRTKPIIDWRYVLREAIKYDVDWSYRNATIEDGVVSANLEEQPLPETEILLDTSGSISETLLKNFLRECKNILKHSKLKVGCFDTKFYGFHEIRTEEDIEKMTFNGGGGTSFDVAVRAFSKRVENKIIFTDGEAPMPNTPLDAIWIVFGATQINPKGGRVIQMDDEQLEKLYSYQQDNILKGRSR